MVMATGSLCQSYDAGEVLHETVGGAAEAEADVEAEAARAAALHERLVAYVHALAPPHDARSGVWGEHSYARARAASAPAAHVRVLLAPPAPSAPPARLDVERDDAPPPSPLQGSSPASPRSPLSPADTDAETDVEEENWESRVTTLAPSGAHAALAEHALDALRCLRLARLALRGGARAQDHDRAAARRLRHALAGAAAPGAARWLHATLLAYLPRSERRLYDIVVAELTRAAPRLAARLTGGRAPPPRACPLSRVGLACGAEAGPWLLWLSAGCERQDARWVRRLGTLLHTRVLAAPGPAAAAPDAWCAAVASALHASLVDALAEAGERPVLLGGAGAGAALCVALAGAAGAVRGLLLLALPLLTAEGARDAPDDPLAELRLPLLLVYGTGAAASPPAALRAVAAAPERRVLEVRGADDALRLPGALRRRRALPQHALDAAIAEECARWALETGEEPRASPPPRAPRRRAPPPLESEEYAHLPAATARIEKPVEVASESASAGRERVVSRGSGSTPLALLPPRRVPASAPASAPAPALAAADIMRLPIVFADDEPHAQFPAAAADDDSPVTVTSGRPYSRVIVASRAPRAAPSRAPRTPRAAAAPRAAPAPRPLLLRRAVRLVRAEPR